MKRDFRILTEIGNLLYKEKNKSAFEPAPGSMVTEEKDLNKNNLFPLSLFQRKGKILNNKTFDYLNSVSPKNLRANLNEP